MKLLAAIVGVALAAPATAIAAEPAMTVRDVPLHGARSLATPTPVFNMIGLHWRGTGKVSFRVRQRDGRWSAWKLSDDDDRIQRGWHLGGLDWTGSADAARFRTTGDVVRLRVYYVSSPVEPVSTRRLQVAGSPLIISRFSWQADESIRRVPPQYSDTVHYAVVHHTAGSSSYTREQSAAIVRGIEIYHVLGNGWNDIGYNFLVDKYGQVFEGRYGGVDRAVIGAHAQGFNAGSVGIAVIGSYGSSGISAAAKASLERLLAWRLDLAHVDPLSTLTWSSGGNPRFPKGVPVFLRAISGHRDTGFTDCPGDALYAMLPQIAKDVAVLGGPKIYAPVAQQSGEGQVRFTAKLSVPQPWTVTVVDSAGTEVAQGAGAGTAVDWTWDGSAVPPDRYSWEIATPNARPATGSLGAVAGLAVLKASASPASVAPGETATVSYTLTAPAAVTATLVSSTNQTLSTLSTAQKPAGAQALTFTPPPGLANGQYAVVLSASVGAGTATATIPLAIDDILTGVTQTGPALSFTLTRAPVSIAFQVLRGPNVVAVPTVPSPVAGPQALTWNELLADGSNAPDGLYTLALTVADEFATFTRTFPVTLDRTAPVVTPLSFTDLRFRVSEPATLVLKVGARTYTRVLKKAATTQFWLKVRPSSYTLTATDPSGNAATVRYRR